MRSQREALRAARIELQAETARRHAALAERQKQQLAEAAAARYGNAWTPKAGAAGGGGGGGGVGGGASAGAPAAASSGFEALPLDDLVRHVLAAPPEVPAVCLGLEPAAGVEAARKRYLTLAKRLHPDKADHPRAAEAFAAVENAWQRLQ